MMSNTTTFSRRHLLGAAGALGVLAATTTTQIAPAHAAVRAAVFWGSSSAMSFRGDSPAGARKITIHDEMTRLGMPTTTEGRPGWRSPELLALRSERHGIRPNYSFVGARQEFPQSGSFVTPILNDFTIPGTSKDMLGFTEGQYVKMETVAHRPGKMRFIRLNRGGRIPIRTAQNGHWVTESEWYNRGRIHLLWMGKNNFQDVNRVLSDTRAAFDREANRTLVLSHWVTDSNFRTPGEMDILARLNSGYRQTYGAQFVDCAAILSDRRWWSLPEIAPLNLAGHPDTGWRLQYGLPPKPLCFADDVHLNSYGNLIMAHGLIDKFKRLGWYWNG